MDVQEIMTSMTMDSVPYPPSSPLSKTDSLLTLGTQRRRRRKGLDSININYYLHLEGGDQQVAP